MAKLLSQTVIPAVPTTSPGLKRMIFDLALRNTVNELYNDLYSATGLASTYVTQEQVAGVYGVFFDSADQTQASVNTAKPVEWDTTGFSNGISTNGTKITVANAGMYHIDFSAQVYSDSSSAKKVWFWPRINGIDISGSTMLFTVSNNTHSNTVARSSVFQFEDGDYLEAMWAVDDTNAWLKAESATAFAPSAPSSVLSICRIGI